MRAVCRELDLVPRPVAYVGDDFNGIFDALADRTCDAVISGTTITPERSSLVLFSQPYLEFDQGVAVNRRLSPNVASTADLRGLRAGIQIGNTSDVVAKRLLSQGAIAGIDYYPYTGVTAALDNLTAGRIGLIIKLFPVISWLVKDRPELTVAMQISASREAGRRLRAGPRRPLRCGRWGDPKAARERRIRSAAVALVRPRGDDMRRSHVTWVQAKHGGRQCFMRRRGLRARFRRRAGRNGHRRERTSMAADRRSSLVSLLCHAPARGLPRRPAPAPSGSAGCSSTV